jgi:hypothetical protein
MGRIVLSADPFSPVHLAIYKYDLTLTRVSPSKNLYLEIKTDEIGRNNPYLVFIFTFYFRIKIENGIIGNEIKNGASGMTKMKQNERNKR